MAFRTSTSAPAETSAPVVTPNKPDIYIWGIYGLMILISIVELYSASSFEIAHQGLYSPLIRHCGFLGVGALIMWGLQNVHFRYFAPAGRYLFWISALAMLYVMLFGEYVNGARRAVSIGFMSIQPAEFIKLSAVLMLSMTIARTQLKKDPEVRFKGLRDAVILVAIMAALLFSQGLTNTLILIGISLSMLLLGSLEWRKFGYILICYALMAGVAAGVKVGISNFHEKNAPKEVPTLVDSRGRIYNIPEAVNGGAENRMGDDTWSNRITRFFDSTPAYERKITPRNLQEMRSYMAQAHGGVFGVHPGNSRETSRLPLAFSDYIYAIIIEDLGLIGGVIVMLLFLSLLARSYMIARKCNHMYPAFLVTGCGVLITLQALFHMAIVTGAFPVSGQPLPLFSKGGTSILVTSMALGIMLSVSRFSVRSKDATGRELKLETEALPEELRAANPTQIV